MTTIYAFNYCAGDDELSIHLNSWQWGWHAFKASDKYLSIEFAQSGYQHVYQPISDAQVRAAAWAIKRDRDYWRTQGVVIPLRLRSHAELEQEGETVSTSGKTDVFSYRDPRTDDLRIRLLARLAALGET